MERTALDRVAFANADVDRALGLVRRHAHDDFLVADAVHPEDHRVGRTDACGPVEQCERRQDVVVDEQIACEPAHDIRRAQPEHLDRPGR